VNVINGMVEIEAAGFNFSPNKPIMVICIRMIARRM